MFLIFNSHVLSIKVFVVFVCAFMSRCVCICSCVGYIGVCLWRSEVNLGYCSPRCPPCFGDMVSDWDFGQAPGFFCLCLPQTGITSVNHHVRFYMGSREQTLYTDLLVSKLFMLACKWQILYPLPLSNSSALPDSISCNNGSIFPLIETL